jgi:hypothetical protein
VEPVEEREVTDSAWYWWNERPLVTLRLTYLSSDPKSQGFEATGEWTVS